MNETLLYFLGRDKPPLSEQQINQILFWVGDEWPYTKGYAQEMFNEHYALVDNAWVPRELLEVS